MTYWQTPDGPFTVKHLAGQSTTGELLVFWWGPPTNWQVVNVSAITGQHIAGPVTSWQLLKGRFNVEHVAGKNSTGELLVFFWSPQADWQVVNVSQITGQQITDVVGISVMGEVEHLAVIGLDKKLYIFSRTPTTDWRVVTADESLKARRTTATVSEHNDCIKECIASSNNCAASSSFDMECCKDQCLYNCTGRSEKALCRLVVDMGPIKPLQPPPAQDKSPKTSTNDPPPRTPSPMPCPPGQRTFDGQCSASAKCFAFALRISHPGKLTYQCHGGISAIAETAADAANFILQGLRSGIGIGAKNCVINVTDLLAQTRDAVGYPYKCEGLNTTDVEFCNKFPPVSIGDDKDRFFGECLEDWAGKPCGEPYPPCMVINP